MKRLKAAVKAASVALSASAGIAAGAAHAQVVSTYGEAVTTALAYNPAVTSAYFEFEAQRQAENVVKGGLLPSVDLSGDYAWQDRQTPIADFGTYEPDSLRFSITQLLFDGFQTRDQMRAARYEKLARYYDFYAASQRTAVSATEAYLNTLQFQELVEYAEDNYVVHRQVFNKIAERAAGGVSQRVDLEQATARMALAESNLLTEVTNLHDTRAEFQRIVGVLPGDNLPFPAMPEQAIPATRADALDVAYMNSPDVNRAIEELRSAREAYNATRGPMYPRFDLRYRNEEASDTDGILGDYELESVEVLMSYNLYRGGTDLARRREFSSRYYAAIEARKDVCLNVRQDTVVAFNDIDVLKRQVDYLSQQLDAQDRTRRAYNDQFDLGQRSLLDLLDSQNEYFNTQRALITARTQLLRAQAITLAQIGALTQALDVQGFNEEKLAELKLKLERDDSEEIPSCPEGFPEAISVDQDEIFRRLNQSAETTDDVFSRASEEQPGIVAALTGEIERREQAVSEEVLAGDVPIFVKAESSTVTEELLTPASETMPAEGAPVEAAAAMVAAPLAPAPLEDAPRPAGAVPASGEAPVEPSVVEFETASVKGERYRVAQDETLWSIASRSRPEGVSVKAMLAGIQHYNASQLEGGDLSRLRAGAELYLPTAADLIRAEQELALAP